MDLEAIPGVGEKTADALETLEDPRAAIERGDVATIASAPDITPARAARIARGAIQRSHDDPGNFLGTDRARAIHRELLSHLQERTVTDYGAQRLQTLYPSARRSRIEEVRSFASRAIDREVDEDVLEALAGVGPLTDPGDLRVRDRCVATADAERYAAANDVLPELSVELVDDARGLAELARGYSTVVAIDEAFAGVDVEGDVRVEPDALETPERLIPERSLSWFAHNRSSIKAACAVDRACPLDVDGDLAALETALERLEPDGSVAGDAELERLTRAVDDLDAAVSTAESVANDRLRSAIGERDVTIGGEDLLSLVERGAGVDSLLSRELAAEHEAAVEAAREHLVDALELEAGEAALARRVFTEEPSYPVEHAEDPLARLREELTAARDRRATHQKEELAAELAGQRACATALVRAALELDVELAIARFVAEYDCAMPTFEWEGRCGVTIEGGRSPLLEEPREAVEPVDYAVSDVTLLSGVNSGGKTSTLDLLAATVILAHMGLPVPADKVRLQRFDACHYHAKTQGTLDAGAFEATIREFADIAGAGADSLVLVDELESITEPGASARIIAGILEALDERDATAVFVSHLAADIQEMARVDVAVDGIEAVGLVDGELVVERSPVKGHLARSTPELIVEKLAEESGDAFYDRLLETFDR